MRGYRESGSTVDTIRHEQESFESDCGIIINTAVRFKTFLLMAYSILQSHSRDLVKSKLSILKHR